MKIVTFSLEAGNKYYGQVDGGEHFYIGSRVNYQGGKGLMNVAGSAAQRYDRNAYRAECGFWADFIHPTAMAEGALFHTLNTYDRAQFTFSFLQFAAHVPNGDFVLFLRELLALPVAHEYFPDLTLHQGRICKAGTSGMEALESNTSTAGLLSYLNPTISAIEDTEVIHAAKFIHWAQNDEGHRDVQIRVGVQNFKTKMVAYAKQYKLDGAGDVACLLVADIRHQGRANSSEIVAALKSATPEESLLELGEDRYPERINVLRHEIALLEADGTYGKRRYSLANQGFAPK